MRKNATIGGNTSPGKGGRILLHAFLINFQRTGLPISHDCRQSHGDQWLLPDHPLQIADKKKNSLTKKMI